MVTCASHKNPFSLSFTCSVASVLRLPRPGLVSDQFNDHRCRSHQHVGQKVTVEGVVVPVTNSAKGNAFINFGGKYPHQTFTGWIPKDSELAGGSTLSGLEGKKIKITGTIDLYKGKPEIKVMSKDQLTSE